MGRPGSRCRRDGPLRRQPAPRPRARVDQANGTAIKGPITTPVGTGFRSVNVALRKSLDLYGQVRPCKSYPGVRSRYETVDRRGHPREHRGPLRGHRARGGNRGGARADRLDRATCSSARSARTPGSRSKPISVTGTRRIVEFAFDYARRNGRRKVTAVHKANIMKFTDGLYLRVAREVAAENEDIEFEDKIVDNLSMQLVQRPEEYDVLVLPNLYGDIVSDLCAGLIGGLGLAPGGNFGTLRGGLRAHARLGAQVHGPEPGEPDGDDALRRDDAPPPGGARRSRPARGARSPP